MHLSSIVEAGLCTSTVAQRVMEGDEKEPGAWGYNWATLPLRDTNTEISFSKLGVECKADDLVL
jgi:hypothetical protein